MGVKVYMVVEVCSGGVWQRKCVVVVFGSRGV